MNKLGNVEIKKEVTVMTKISFIMTVVDISCPTDKEYYEPLREIGFQYAILTYLTNLDVTSNKEATLREIEDFVNKNKSVIEYAKSEISTTLLSELSHGIDVAIEVKTGYKANDISKAVTNLISTIQSKIENFDTTKLNSFIENFSNFDEKKIVQSYFDGVKFSDK